MKFGKLLKLNTLPEWKDWYFDYKGLKALVERLQVLNKKREQLVDAKHKETEKARATEREHHKKALKELKDSATAAGAVAGTGAASGAAVGSLKRAGSVVVPSATSSVGGSGSTTPAIGGFAAYVKRTGTPVAGAAAAAAAGSPFVPPASVALQRAALPPLPTTALAPVPVRPAVTGSPARLPSPLVTPRDTTGAVVGAQPHALLPAASTSAPSLTAQNSTGSSSSSNAGGGGAAAVPGTVLLAPGVTLQEKVAAAAEAPELRPLLQLSSSAVGRSPVIAAAVAAATGSSNGGAAAAALPPHPPAAPGSSSSSSSSGGGGGGGIVSSSPGLSALAAGGSSSSSSAFADVKTAGAVGGLPGVSGSPLSPPLAVGSSAGATALSPPVSGATPDAAAAAAAGTGGAGGGGGGADAKLSLEEQERRLVEQIQALRTEFFAKLDKEIKKVTEFFNTQLTKFQADWRHITEPDEQTDAAAAEANEHTAMLPSAADGDDGAGGGGGGGGAAASDVSVAIDLTTPIADFAKRPLSTRHSKSSHHHGRTGSASRLGNESTRSRGSAAINEFRAEGTNMREADAVPWYRRVLCCEDDFTYSPVRADGGQRSPQSPTHKAVHAKLERLLVLYRHSLQLQAFREINFLGVSKIVKKYDKNMNESHRVAVVARYSTAELHRSVELEELIAMLEQYYNSLAVELAIAQDRDVTTAVAVIKRVRAEVTAKTNQQVEEAVHDHVRPLWLGVSVVLALAVWFAPVLQAEPHAHRCLVLLTLITSLWVTEAIPYFVSALCIPVLVVWMEILQDDNGDSVDADKASRITFANFFDDTSALVLGGFSIAAAFGKCQFELRIADVMQTHFGKRPSLFLFVLMALCFFLSMWISNVAAPLLCTAVLTPFIHDLPKSHPFARALLLGLAFAGNLGGMLSPISSPQNAIALGYLEGTQPEHAISFMQWIQVSVPVCTVCLIAAWLYLNFFFLRRDHHLTHLPEIFYEEKKMTPKHYLVLGISAFTITLWCTLSYTKDVLGQMGVVGLVPLVVFFATGILEKADLGKFSWNLLLLIGGGHVLGGAVTSSKLLDVLTGALEPALEGGRLWVSAVAMVSVVFLISTFVSHTVCALILMPLIVSLGSRLHHTRTLVTLTTLMMSGTMSLPMSSFPNVNSLLIEDDSGNPYLHSLDFITHGTPIALVALLTICTIGFGLVEAVFTVH